MFDWVHCDYPLPGEPLEFVKEFQTKNLECWMQDVTIDADGNLVGRSYFNGLIEFYGSNIVAAGPAGRYTRNGEDSESVTFEATFNEGKLTEIKQVAYEREPALASSEMMHPHKMRLGSELYENDSFTGKKLFVLWGGREADEGYYVEIVYETDKQLCVKKENGRLELMERFQIGNLIFKDKEEARADREHMKVEIEKEKEEYQRKIREKIEKREKTNV